MINKRLILVSIVSLLIQSCYLQNTTEEKVETTAQSINGSQTSETGPKEEDSQPTEPTLGVSATNEDLSTPQVSTTKESDPSGWGWIWIPLALIAVVLGIILIFVILCYRNKDEKTDSKQGSTGSVSDKDDKDDKFPVDSMTEHRNAYDYKFDLKPDLAKTSESGTNIGGTAVSTTPSNMIRSEIESPSQTGADKKKTGSTEKITLKVPSDSAGADKKKTGSAEKITLKEPSDSAGADKKKTGSTEKITLKVPSDPAGKTQSNTAAKKPSNGAANPPSNPPEKKPSDPQNSKPKS